MDIFELYNKGQNKHYYGDVEYDDIDNILSEYESIIDPVYDTSINDLILDPEYKFIETLEKSDEFIDSFWGWMNAYAYGGIVGKGDKIHYYYIYHRGNIPERIKNPSFQMLLFYYIKFIKECVEVN
jgi:hypothetical protein